MIALRPLNQFTLVAVAMLSLPGSTAAAQCPDGSPPPCQTQTVASATTRRVNPPLDDRTWIVVPFDNLAKSADADWMRVASVNLLYLGMSRWTDVRVIDDERVADFMRDVPEARSSPNTLSLNAGLAVAKRAGAGKLVMGDVLKLGNRTAVTAKVFDVKTGQRLRSVREETAVLDSVMPMFGRLAQKVLNIPPPPGANVGVVGTTSIAAYREYVQGMQALNLFDMQRARQHLETALVLDSAFALAHAKLSVLGGWISPNDQSNRVHAEAAARLSAPLPPRERAIINANVAFARRDYVKACEGFGGVLRGDSTDTDAWYGLGDCLFHDLAVEAANGDTTRLQWRGNLNESVRAFRHALDLDPTYHLAYSHIVDAYNSQFRSGQWCVEGRCRQVIAVVRIAGDSLVTAPILLPRDTAVFRAHMEDYRRTHARRQTLDRGRRVAEQWVAANPSEDRARLMHATVLLLLGRPQDADSTLRRARLNDSSNAASAAILARLEIAVKLWRGADAVRLYDSVRSHAVGFAGPMTTGNLVTLVAPTFGRMKQYDSLVAAGTPQGVGSSRFKLARETLRLMVGAPTDSLVAVERSVFDELAGAGGPALASRSIGYSLSLGLRIPRPSWPPLDTMVSDPRVRLALAFKGGDTAALRTAVVRLDSLSSVYLAAMSPDTGATLVAAEGYLALRDSLAALRVTRRWLDSSLVFTPLLIGSGGTQVQPLLPRAALLRADLAGALGQKAEALLWYGRWLSLWSTADVEFQPLVDRVRKSYTALGGT